MIRDQGIVVDEAVLGRPEAERLAEYGADEEAEDADLIIAEGETHFANWTSDPSNPSYRELLITLPLGEKGNPKRAPATHWDTEAVVAHAT